MAAKKKKKTPAKKSPAPKVKTARKAPKKVAKSAPAKKPARGKAARAPKKPSKVAAPKARQEESSEDESASSEHDLAVLARRASMARLIRS